jgi:uncharacterized protein with PIN domain
MILLSDRDPFGFGKWQDFLTQLAFLEEHSLSVEDVKKSLLVFKDKQSNSLRCPQCEAPMQIFSVNHDSATQTNDDSKSVWLCRNCLYEQFSIKTVNEELELLKES